MTGATAASSILVGPDWEMQNQVLAGLPPVGRVSGDRAGTDGHGRVPAMIERHSFGRGSCAKIQRVQVKSDANPSLA